MFLASWWHLALVAAEPIRVVSAQADAQFNALFQNKSGWIGADGNYSLALSPEKTLWFFSDTWTGDIAEQEPGRLRRERTKLINNSVGVQVNQAGQNSVKFYWGKTRSGEATALFRPQENQGENEASWFWPFAGVVNGEAVQLLLWEMEKAEGPAAFGFKNKAVWLGTIANPHDSPDAWRVTQQPFPFTEIGAEERTLYGSAICRQEDWAYVYGVRENSRNQPPTRHMLVARVPVREFSRFNAWRFWTGSEWHADYHQAQSQFEGLASEYSVTYVPSLKQYIAVYHDAFLSPKIVARTAEAPHGPWSEKIELASSPEATWGRNIFCYSGKAHAAFSLNNELVISYAANSHRWPEVLEDARLYWPRFLRVKLETK